MIIAALRKRGLTIVVALLALVALASTMTYAAFLVVGVLGDHLGTGRFLAGLLLAILFARIPSLSNGKLRTVGLIPKPARRPIMMGLLALCLLTLLSRGAHVQAIFVAFATIFLISFPWIRRAVLGRIMGSLTKFTPDPRRRESIDDGVIDVEFREKKD